MTSSRLRSLIALVCALCALPMGALAAADKDQQKCINSLNKDAVKVASKQGKENTSCIKNAGKGKLQTRRDVLRNVKKVRVPVSILGGSFRFSTKTNDPLNAKFYIFQIQPNGTYKLVS